MIKNGCQIKARTENNKNGITCLVKMNKHRKSILHIASYSLLQRTALTSGDICALCIFCSTSVFLFKSFAFSYFTTQCNR
mmetsp:Transcript_15193/g.20316  ORF Transcript_15193/g.20316 Transcript_15193/m.20316 type:complete len:80 (+) Transcript_15193:160-399(+)